jgi:hypothetical protein
MTNTNEKTPIKLSPWSKENLSSAMHKVKEERVDLPAMAIATAKKPLHQNSLAKAGIVLVGSATLAALGLLFFANPPEQAAIPVAEVPKVEDPEGNTDGWDAAAKQSTANGLAVDVPTDKPLVPATQPSPTVKPSAVPKTKTPVATTPTTPAVSTKPQIIYRTAPQPVVAKAPITPKPPTQSFIPFGGGQVAPRQRPVAAAPAAVATAPKVVRTPKAPLPSEQFLLTKGAYRPADQLVSGATVPGRLSSAMQSSQGTSAATTMIRVVLDKPLLTNKGFMIPKGATIAFNAVVNPQNGAITAESIDGEYLGKKILIPKGSIALQAANNQPLIATEFKPRMGDLATADRSNAFFGAVGEIGNELTKGQASINVGNGSTIIQQTNNNPNILGAVLKGGAQTYANDQRQRTQQEASKIMAGQPVQFLAAGTPVSLTVVNPAMVKIPL